MKISKRRLKRFTVQELEKLLDIGKLDSHTSIQLTSQQIFDISPRLTEKLVSKGLLSIKQPIPH